MVLLVAAITIPPPTVMASHVVVEVVGVLQFVNVVIMRFYEQLLLLLILERSFGDALTTG